jgi:hypothetical protein
MGWGDKRWGTYQNKMLTLASLLCYMEVEIRLKEKMEFFYILHKIWYSVHHLVTKEVVCIPECMTFMQKASSSESWTGQKVF